MSLLNNLFGRRSRGISNFLPFGRRHAPAMNARRGGMALGTIAAIAAPFIIRKLRARSAQRSAANAGY